MPSGGKGDRIAGRVFAVGETSKSFTVTATDDLINDGGESVRLGFGTLPNGFVAGVRPTATR